MRRSVLIVVLSLIPALGSAQSGARGLARTTAARFETALNEPHPGSGDTSPTTASAPAGAAQAFERGLEQLAAQPPDLAKAQKQFEKATKSYPAFAVAWAALGRVLARRGEPEKAAIALRQAIEADPAYPGAYRALIAVYVEQQDWVRALDCASRLRELRPDDVRAAYMLAFALYNAGRLDEAASAANAIITGPRIDDAPETFLLLAWIRARQRRFPEAEASLRSYLTTEPGAPEREELAGRLAVWGRP